MFLSNNNYLSMNPSTADSHSDQRFTQGQTTNLQMQLWENQNLPLEESDNNLSNQVAGNRFSEQKQSPKILLIEEIISSGSESESEEEDSSSQSIQEIPLMEGSTGKSKENSSIFSNLSESPNNIVDKDEVFRMSQDFTSSPDQYRNHPKGSKKEFPSFGNSDPPGKLHLKAGNEMNLNLQPIVLQLVMIHNKIKSKNRIKRSIIEQSAMEIQYTIEEKMKAYGQRCCSTACSFELSNLHQSSQTIEALVTNGSKDMSKLSSLNQIYREHLLKLMTLGELTNDILILALIYLLKVVDQLGLQESDRLKNIYSTCAFLAFKFLEEESYWPIEEFALLTEQKKSELEVQEHQVLHLLDYKLWVRSEEFNKFKDQLLK